MKRLILFAHPAEASPTIELLRAEAISPHLYQCDLGLIAISGMGCLSAACTVTQYASQVDEVWNLGICGSLTDRMGPESFHWIGSASKYIPNRTSRLDVHPTLGEGGARLLSSDTPIYDHSLRKELSQSFDLVDMEGYGVAMAAQRLGLPYKLGKIVSDTAEEGGWKELQQRLPKLAQMISERLAPSPTFCETQDTC